MQNEAQGPKAPRAVKTGNGMQWAEWGLDKGGCTFLCGTSQLVVRCPNLSRLSD